MESPLESESAPIVVLTSVHTRRTVAFAIGKSCSLLGARERVPDMDPVSRLAELQDDPETTGVRPVLYCGDRAAECADRCPAVVREASDAVGA